MHRRRIKDRKKAKVVGSVWGTEFIHFLVVLAIMYIVQYKDAFEE